jgi:hypothetical protein
MNFGNYGIIDKVSLYFALEPEWSWDILPITSGMELDRSKFMLHNRMVMDLTGTRRELPPTWLEIAHREIALTFGGTTIPLDKSKPVKDGGEPALKTGATVLEVEAFLKTMPQPMIIEIWKKIAELYKDWGPTDPNSL